MGTEIAQLLSFRAYQAFTDGKIAEGFALIDRGLDLAEAAGDAEASLWVAVEKVYALASTGQNAAANNTPFRTQRPHRPAAAFTPYQKS